MPPDASLVLAAVDFSDDARRAAWRAALVAAEQGARLELVHVMNRASASALRGLLRPQAGGEGRVLDSLRAMLDGLAAEIPGGAGTMARTRVIQGEVVPSLLEAASAAGLVVVGARGWNPIRDMLLGSTAERLLGRCRRPVLVARRPAKTPYRRVVAAIDFSTHSRAALDLAMRLAPHAGIMLVHAYGVAFEGKLRLAGVDDERLRAFRAEARREALARMAALAASIEGDRSRLSQAVTHGHPPGVLLAKAAQLRADLIVIGKRGGTLAEDLVLGSVTRHVLADAACDVLVVQEGAGGA